MEGFGDLRKEFWLGAALGKLGWRGASPRNSLGTLTRFRGGPRAGAPPGNLPASLREGSHPTLVRGRTARGPRCCVQAPQDGPGARALRTHSRPGAGGAGRWAAVRRAHWPPGLSAGDARGAGSAASRVPLLRARAGGRGEGDGQRRPSGNEDLERRNRGTQSASSRVGFVQNPFRDRRVGSGSPLPPGGVSGQQLQATEA